MKKLLGIVVLGLLLINTNVNAEIITFNCKSYVSPVKLELNEMILDTSRKTITYKWIETGKAPQSYVSKNIKINGSIVTEKIQKSTFEFDYSGDLVKVYQIKPLNKLTNDCSRKGSDFAAKQKKIEISDMIDKAKETCKSLGFNEGTEKFADCSLKLYSQSVELAAEQNKTVVMQPQSSGSNVMTIYDPVRDSNALMNKGMKMLNGGCTLGVNC